MYICVTKPNLPYLHHPVAAMTFRNRLVGTWRLNSIKITDNSTGAEVHPMTEHVQGALMYAPDGYMCCNLTTPDVRPYAAGWNSPTPDEAMMSAKMSNGYTGKYFLDEKPGNKQTLIHEIRLSHPPNFAGTSQKRHVEVWDEEDKQRMRITVDGDVKMDDGSGKMVLEWTKEPLNMAIEPEAEVVRLNDQ